jgi:hypothetical protein
MIEMPKHPFGKVPSRPTPVKQPWEKEETK